MGKIAREREVNRRKSGIIVSMAEKLVGETMVLKVGINIWERLIHSVKK